MAGMGGFYFLFFGFEALNAQKKVFGDRWDGGGGSCTLIKVPSAVSISNMVVYIEKFIVI